MSSPSALILAAGLGTRLDPLTRLVAKPAAPLGDRTLVEHVLAWLRTQRIRDVVVNLHYRPSTVAAVLGDGAHLGMRVRYSWEPVILGSAGGPRRALPLLDSDPFVIVNGDTLCAFDLTAMVEAHRSTRADVTMAAIPNPARHHYNGILIDDGGAVTGFIPKGHTTASWHFVGVQIVNKAVFAALPDGVAAETVAGIYRERLLSTPGSIRIWPVTTPFLDIGTPRDYLSAVLQLRRGTQDAAPVNVTASAVWPDAHIDTHAMVEGSIVAGAVHVPGGRHLRDVIVVPAGCAREGDGARVEGDLAIYPIDRDKS